MCGFQRNPFPCRTERIHLLIKIDVQHLAAVLGKTLLAERRRSVWSVYKGRSNARNSMIIAKKQRAAGFDQSHT
jgi:hypothetical protein